ncbi:unnamed protein product [Cylicostephanus goldi]|uniref:Uncharacterized protein n=1 Tax=Cylicostephanus goldi TaxID=71465 RepID=A0A3P6RRL2_CYLGO|nr:unnamed protein product [Cylicostephanus goldi]
MPTIDPSESIPYVNAELYVPYTVCSSRLQNGDLIDLGSVEDDSCPELTLEQIRREFDPLYRPLEKRSQNSSSLQVPGSSVEEVEVPSVTRTQLKKGASSEEENKENSEQNWLSLDCISLQDHVPSVLQQIAIVKEKGMKNCTSSSLFFMSPIADYMTTSAKSVKIVVSKDYTWPHCDQSELAFTSATETSVELLITQLLADLLSESELVNGVPVERYGLKVRCKFIPLISVVASSNHSLSRVIFNAMSFTSFGCSHFYSDPIHFCIGSLPFPCVLLCSSIYLFICLSQCT